VDLVAAAIERGVSAQKDLAHAQAQLDRFQKQVDDAKKQKADLLDRIKVSEAKWVKKPLPKAQPDKDAALKKLEDELKAVQADIAKIEAMKERLESNRQALDADMAKLN